MKLIHLSDLHLGKRVNDVSMIEDQKYILSRILEIVDEAAPDAVLMFCKHCLRYSMGWCPVRHKEKSLYKEPYYLVSADGKRFRLDFDCKHCQMKVLS